MNDKLGILLLLIFLYAFFSLILSASKVEAGKCGEIWKIERYIPASLFCEEEP